MSDGYPAQYTFCRANQHVDTNYVSLVRTLIGREPLIEPIITKVLFSVLKRIFPCVLLRDQL